MSTINMQTINNKNLELLAPAGSFDAMLAAVANGANAIYLGGSLFSARALATNFTNDEIKDTVKHCHLYNVKVYVTVNVLYSDDEFEQLIDYINFLYINQVDALIIQDLGLLKIVRDIFPDFEVHMSTQASVYNEYGVDFFKKLGVKRVVLARENTIEEISAICNSTNLDIEVFVHGALCMSYSGQCLFSSLIAKRSGNKGSCGQPCRLGYHILKDDKTITKDPSYLLSPKDLCTIENVGELIDAGVTSFKIEGRMKRPEYVASIVRQYRNAIDKHLNDIEQDYKNSVFEMKYMFNRGFTKGHIFNDENLLSKNFPGHQGLYVGDVTNYNKNKKIVSIRLSDNLKQHDRILFKNSNITRTVTKLFLNNKLVNSAQKGDLIELEMNDFIKNNDVVHVTYKNDLVNELSKTYIDNDIKFPIVMSFVADIEKQMLNLTMKQGSYIVSINNPVSIELAVNTPLSKDRISKQLKKLGDSIYYCESIEIDFDEKYTFSIKELNQLRRDAVLLLNKKRLEIYSRSNKNYIQDKKNTHRTLKKRIVKVRNINQYEAAIKHKGYSVYFPVDGDLEDAHKIAIKYNIDLNVYTGFLTSEETLKDLIISNVFVDVFDVIVSDYRALELLKNHKNCTLDRYFNLYNSNALNLMSEYNSILSIETKTNHLKSIHSNNEIYCYVYGFIETMNLKHCIISDFYHNKKIKGCNKCKNGCYSLLDRTKSSFEIYPDKDCNNTVYHDRPIVIEQYHKLNVDGIVLSFSKETINEVDEILNFYKFPNNSKCKISHKYGKTNGYLKV